MLKNPLPLSCMTTEDNLSTVSRQCVVLLPQKQQRIIKGLPKVLCTQLPIGEAVLETRLAVASRKSSVCPAQWDELGEVLELSSGSVSSHYTIIWGRDRTICSPIPRPEFSWSPWPQEGYKNCRQIWAVSDVPPHFPQKAKQLPCQQCALY